MFIDFAGKLFQDRIAVFLIGGAFILIGGILAIHFYSSVSLIEKFNVNVTKLNIVEITTLYREINNSNTNIFSIILSLFGAWIGAVLAFYFGSKSLEKAYSSLSQAQESINNLVSDNRLAGIKIQEIIQKYPNSTDFKKYKINEKLKVIVNEDIEKYPCVIITDINDKKILGLLFFSELTKVKSKEDLLKVEETFEQFIVSNQVTDHITNKRWTSTGVQNFVSVNMEDTLKKIVEEMTKIGDTLSVRAVVMEKESPKAIVTYDMISKEIQK